jgi:hypothetical protein
VAARVFRRKGGRVAKARFASTAQDDVPLVLADFLNLAHALVHRNAARELPRPIGLMLALDLHRGARGD